MHRDVTLAARRACRYLRVSVLAVMISLPILSLVNSCFHTRRLFCLCHSLFYFKTLAMASVEPAAVVVAIFF